MSSKLPNAGRFREIIASSKADPTISSRRLREIVPPEYHHLIRSTRARKTPRAPR